MSDVMATVHCDDAVQRRAPAEDRKRKKKKKRFRKRMQDLERKGRWEGQRKRRAGQSRQNQAPPQHNGEPTNQPSHPAPTLNTSLPHPSSTAGASSCASMPSTSTSSTPSSTVTVSKKSTQTSAGIPTKYLAMDCEMVGTGPKGSISQLARCSLVSYEGDVIYDKFIRPPVPVTDYRTRWSGIRRSDLIHAVPFSDARKEILKLLAGKVVIGHAVHNDFRVLSYSHPAALTRDTSRIPLLNQKAGFAVHECASLKRLTKAIFNRDIQTGRRGHSSVEDAKATLELYKVVEQDWERELASRSRAT